MAALWYALGAADSALLTGWFGDFMLTGEEVQRAIPQVERAFARTGTRLAQTTARITDWMSVMSRESDFNAEGLLDGSLRVLRHCAERGLGATAFSLCY